MSEYRYHGEIKSVLECVENARDLGGYPLTDGGVTASGRVIRCEVPLNPADGDLGYLRNGGFDTVIDLRDEKTAEKLPHGLKNREGFKYYSCPVDAGSKPAEIVEEVPLTYMEIPGIRRFTGRGRFSLMRMAVSCTTARRGGTEPERSP